MTNLKFGLFIPPIHFKRYPVADTIDRDLELAEVVDGLGDDTIWFGEHHSDGVQTGPSPELMIAAAAQRTHRIQLCAGVISLPYHHPLMVADRIGYLDQMTRGRAVFGFGPGANPRDGYMLGIEYTDLRPRMEESLEAILELFSGDELVDMKSDWFQLREARVQNKGYRNQQPKFVVAHAFTPSGPRLAGKHGLGLLSFGGSSPAGLESLRTAWDVVEEEAARAGKKVSRSEWSIVDLMHIAETEEEAIADLERGLGEFFDAQVGLSSGTPLWSKDENLSVREMVKRINESGTGCIGTPERAIEHINKKIEATGGFGELLFFTGDMTSPEATERMHRLFAREVMPHFRYDPSRQTRELEYEYLQANREMLMDWRSAGLDAAQTAYDAEKSARRQNA
jgi:limonene 1,2-monooxygenase